MANQEHVEILEQGVAVWNAWRREHPEIEPQLEGANFPNILFPAGNLRNANLRGALLPEASLQRADLSNADLYGANLNNASLSETRLENTNLAETQLAGSNLQFSRLYRTNLDGIVNLTCCDQNGTHSPSDGIAFYAHTASCQTWNA